VNTLTTVTDLQVKGDLNFLYGAYNIIDCGIRTGKTYWAVNNLKQFSRDERLDRVLFLVDTNSLKESILAEYGDNCCDADYWWEAHSTWGEQTNKIGVMCYQALGMKALRGELDFLSNIDCICWDECDSIFDFAAAAFAKARKSDFAREETTNEEILAVIQRYSSKRDYMPLVLLGEWERIVNQNRIMCIGLSATPERARAYYYSLTSSANVGKLQVSYRQAEDIFFHNLREHICKLMPEPGRGYWCYSPWILENKNIVELANSLGFHAIELHSSKNSDHPMTEEQNRVSDIILTTGMVPIEYDFVIVNKAFERGYNIRDQRFNQLIVNSTDQAEREQAARMTHNYTRALKTYAPPVPEEFLEVWLPVEQCRELAERMAVPETDKNNSGKIMTWNKLKDFLPFMGYSVEGKKKKNKGKVQQCYYITGSWRDVEIVDGNFMILAEAKAKLDS
jgi:hypothetical protein